VTPVTQGISHSYTRDSKHTLYQDMA